MPRVFTQNVFFKNHCNRSPSRWRTFSRNKKSWVFLVELPCFKLLFMTLYSRITILASVSFASNSFRIEQDSSVAELYSSRVSPETLISLMSYSIYVYIYYILRAQEIHELHTNGVYRDRISKILRITRIIKWKER